MPRRAASVTQADIARIVRGMRDAGVPAVRVRITPAGVIIEADRPESDDLDRREPADEPEKVIVV